MAFDSNFIDELKMNVNIVDVVGREVSLKKAGANYKGLCPFHSEKTPSFMVNEEKQIFNCFGCGEKGDVIKFVQSYYKIPFMDAVDKLCDEYGIKKPERSNAPKVDYSKYYDINAKAAKFFYKQLTQGPNKGYSYISGRGISDQTITHFGLGYAPDSWNALSDHLRSVGVSDEDMLKLGLVSQGKKGVYDKFRDRVMFPIFSTQGKVIGFGGRAIGDVMPKYLNSSESDVFLKKNNLYALNFTKKDISDEDVVVMVEGYMDAISLYQSGIRNVAASLGTALTDNQARLITRYTKNVVLSYDSDNAGVNAALRGIGVIKKAGGNVRVLRIDDGKDPDEFVKKHGKEAFGHLIKDAIPGTDFRLMIEERGFDLNSDMGVLEYIKRIVPVLRSLGPVEQNLYVRKLAEKFNLSERSIMAEVNTESADNVSRPSPAARSMRSRDNDSKVSDDRDLRLEMSMLILTMNNTRYIKRIKDDGISFRSTLARDIWAVVEHLSDGAENGTHRIEADKITQALDPDEDREFQKFLRIIKLGPDDEAFYEECRTTYQVNAYKDRRVELLHEISVSEMHEDSSETARLGAELVKINNLIKTATEGKNGKRD